ncbi:CLUMA_CG014109, isoform A [Clunio marinus]|uniref:CLUMA_CG014109, isoform A n=1 Tax=Clunio marinus TaxID=568069 RepID=A0A1J1IM98_9DIPT|nr:CLUMA_CG014109, isoform A [Clunio marinus]
MFSYESTENLLDNLENEIELSEVVTFDNSGHVEANDEKISVEITKPIPSKRNVVGLKENPQNPVPVVRKLQSLDKNEKNDENEIIQLSSVSSSASESHRHISQHTVIPKVKESSNLENQTIESEDIQTEETFFVVKHGKWAQDEVEQPLEQRETSVIVHEETGDADVVSLPFQHNEEQFPHFVVISEKKTKSPVKSLSSSSVSSATRTSVESSSESISSEKNIQPEKTKKHSKNKDKKKIKGKYSANDQITTSENSENTKMEKEPSQTIGMKISISPKNVSDKNFPGIFLHSTGVLDYNLNYKELRVKVSLFNEDSGKQIGDPKWSRVGIFHNNFHNLICVWNEMIFIDQNFHQLQETFNDVLLFFEITNLYGIVTFWAFMKLFSTSKKTENLNRKWEKLPGQACKIPNKKFHKVTFNEKGSMNVKFSYDGNLIAFTEVAKNSVILHIQKFPEMQEVFKMLEHSDLIHDIDWLKQKHSLKGVQWMLTCSSDFTGIVWKLEQNSYTYHVLPHPAFIYASKFLQHEDTSKLQVVTAGRDCIVRIWQIRKNLEGFELVQELKHPNMSKSSYITTIATRNSDAFYTSTSKGDIVEWTLRVHKEYHMNRHFKIDEIEGNIITCLELHPRGNKIFFRIQDFSNNDRSSVIYVLGITTGLITQFHQQPTVKHEPHGRLKVTTCGSHLFTTNGSLIRFYSMFNGNLTSLDRNFLNIRVSSADKISSIDYHPKDFYFACSIYGHRGGVIICNFECESDEKNLFEKLKVHSQVTTQNFELMKTTPTKFADIIRKLDEVFLAPIGDNEITNKRQETLSQHDENSSIVNSKRSQTYTVSQGPATYTVEKNQNNTYEIQRNDDTDEDDTTISESFD